MDRDKLKQLNKQLADKTVKFEQSVASLKQQIHDLKAACTHTRFVYKYGSNTGNYDPSADCYWIDIACLDCGMKKSYYDDSNLEEYHYWSRRKYDKDVELVLEEDEYILIKEKGLLV